MSKLETIELKKGIETLGVGVFKNCAKLSSIKVAIDNMKYQSIEGVLYTKPESANIKAIILIEYPMNKEGKTYNIEQVDITEIKPYAFYNHSTLAFIELNDKLTTIGKHAFEETKSIKTIILPQSVTTIGSKALLIQH